MFRKILDLQPLICFNITNIFQGYSAHEIPQGMGEVSLIAPGTLLTVTKPSTASVIQVDMEGEFIADVQQRNNTEVIFANNDKMRDKTCL